MSDLKQSFFHGFMKRAEEYCFPTSRAQEMFDNIDVDTMFNVRGFTDKELSKDANFTDSLHHFKEAILPTTHDSIFDAVKDSRTDDDDIWAVGKHIGSHGVVPGLLGAGVGGTIGGLTSDKKKSTLGRIGKGALAGGALGFGVGAGHDAYHLGDNTRNQLIEWAQESKQLHPDKQSKDHIDKGIDTMKKSYWYEFYNPDHIDKKTS